MRKYGFVLSFFFLILIVPTMAMAMAIPDTPWDPALTQFYNSWDYDSAGGTLSSFSFTLENNKDLNNIKNVYFYMYYDGDPGTLDYSVTTDIPSTPDTVAFLNDTTQRIFWWWFTLDPQPGEETVHITTNYSIGVNAAYMASYCTPLPAAVWFLGLGLVGLAAARKRR